jgi:hypothetical protein
MAMSQVAKRQGARSALSLAVTVPGGDDGYPASPPNATDLENHRVLLEVFS